MIALLVATVVLVVLAWAAALLLGLPVWIPVVLTVLAAVGVGALVAARRVLASRKAARIERALVAQAVQGQGSLRPDLAADVESMTKEFQRAIAALRSSRLKGGGAGALYALPWYVIVGPPGAGKSTALRSSGLPFPYLPSQTRGSIKGIGGTRNCDWWLTNDAVLLDTAGRWTTQEDDHEWLAFLDLVARHRPRRPLNGILVAVSVDDLASSGDDARAALAARIRERIDEVSTRLEVALPVYVLVTKCDLLPGFVEAFGDVPRSARGQIWGYTLPFRELGIELASTLDARFGEIVAAVRRRVIQRIGHERRAEARELMAGFPSQLETLGEPLTHFLVELFQPNVYRQSPVLRGTYFTSGTQEGTPIDRLLGRLAETASASAQVAVPHPVAEPKSYFLTRVFYDVVFPDARLVAPTRRSAQRRAALEVALGASMLALAASVVVASAVSWSMNRRLLGRTAGALAAVEIPKDASAIRAPLPPSSLEALRASADELRRYDADGAPWTMRMGLYSGGELLMTATDAYARAMREGVVVPLVRAEGAELDAWGRRFESDLDARPTADEHRRSYDALERYLRLTVPRAPDEPPDAGAERERIVTALASRWAATSGAAEHAMLETHLRFFAELSSERPGLLAPRDPGTVRRARVALGRLGQSEVAVAELVRETEGHGYDLTLQRMVGTTGGAISATAHVRGAFTRRAWEERVRARIDEAGASRSGAAWVLGPTRGDALDRRAQLRAELRAEYFAAYVREWQQFVRSVRTRSARQEPEALTLLEDLTRGEPAPMGRLIAAIDHNTMLLDPAAVPADDPSSPDLLASLERRVRGNAPADAGADDASAGPASVLASPEVRSAFAGLVQFAVADAESGSPAVGLDVYQEQLEFLRDALTTHRDDPASGAQLLTRLQAARTRVRSLIAEQPVGWRPLFETLLWPPIDAAATTSTEAMAGSTARSWCASIAVPYFATLAGRFPFDEDGHDAAIADFAAFYRPGTGTLWTFYGETLGAQVERDGARFVFATRLGRDAGSVYRSTLPLFLERSDAITRAFFPPGATEPRVDLDVRVRPVPGAASVRFQSGGATIDHRNGPERWSRVTWPGERPDAGASIEVLGANGLHERVSQEGEWGLFRLLGRATRIAGGGPGARSFTVTWRLPSHGVDVSVDIRLVRAESPFFAAGDRRGRMLAPLRAVGVQAPRVITVRDGECSLGG